MNGQNKILKDINSPVLFKGDEKTAYRDPAVLFHNDQFFLFFTLVKTIKEEIYSFTATSKSFDLDQFQFIYGGSVDSKNVKNFMLTESIDGFLVGGASLSSDEFIKIVKLTI